MVKLVRSSGESIEQFANGLFSNPIQSVSDPTLACNDDGTSGALQLTASAVAAGTKITAYWNNPWPHPYGPQVSDHFFQLL